VAWFALVDSRISRGEFGHGDLFLTVRRPKLRWPRLLRALEAGDTP
jgi:hypothetical protein